MRAAIAAVDPARLVARALGGAAGSALGRFEGLYVCAAGKASEGMLRAFCEWAGPRALGTIVARGSHPTPDRESVRAAEAALDFARWTTDRVGLVLLLSGGASAMMALPADPITLDEKIETSGLLLASGASIDGINCVRKHLSAIKGGWLGARASAACTLAISDVTGPREGDPSVIGSGPGVPDRTTFQEAIAVLQRHGIWERVPPGVSQRLDRGRRGLVEETPKPGDARLSRSVAHVIGGRHDAMTAARDRAEALGYAVTVIADAVRGEAATAAAAVVGRASALARGRRGCVISSGETTVTVRGRGRGGRNQELALAAIDALARLERPAALASVGTDGMDGPTDAAGALVDSSSAARARSVGLDAPAALAGNDSYPALDQLGDLLRTGATGTNVGDLQVLLVG